MSETEREALINLAKSASLAEAEQAVEVLEKKCGYGWRPVGDNEANYGLINLGSDPGHALIERITNAIDGVIERESLRQARKSKQIPATPREAVEAWLGVPGGRVANLGDPAKRQPLADNIIVRLLEGTHKRRPTVAILDFGVGLTATQMPKTILSLSASNKIDKPYLAGAYGQGGSTVLAFSPKGTLFVSRRQTDLLPVGEQDEVAVTFACYEELDPAKNKNGRYAYLVNPRRNVPSIPAGELRSFKPGTLVVHFDLEIGQYAARLTQLTGSLWWLLQNALFDPILPFWAEDHRESLLGKSTRPDRRTIAGNFTRLSDDKRDRVEHSDSVDVTLEHASGATSVRINYWVIKEREEGGGQPIDAYVDPYHPIAYTYFGQTHGTDERRFVAERLQLPYLAKFLILQVELDPLTPAARRDLLSSTRDRLKRTPFFEHMREAICIALSEDDELIRLNELRKEQILRRHSEKDREKMRERFAELLERLAPGVVPAPRGKGGEPGGREPSGSSSREPLKPLPTKDAPTFIRIANTRLPVPVRIDRHALLRLESDAPDAYLSSHIHARLALVSQPEGHVVLESRSDFRGGRARMAFHVSERAKAGDAGRLSVFLFTPKAEVFQDRANYRVEEPKQESTAGTNKRSHVKAPQPIPVTEDEWPTFSWHERSVAEVREDNEGGKIFVNMDNQHLLRLLRSGGYQETGLVRMKNNFLLYVAFFAWAQFVAQKGKETNLDGAAFERYREEELDRAAQTVIHSIAAGSRLAEEDGA